MRGREEATLSQQHTSPGQEAEEEVEGLKASSVQDSSQVWEAETGGKKWWVNSCPGATKVRPFPWDTRLILQTLSTIPYLLEYFLLPHIIPTIGGRKVQKKIPFQQVQYLLRCFPTWLWNSNFTTCIWIPKYHAKCPHYREEVQIRLSWGLGSGWSWDQGLAVAPGHGFMVRVCWALYHIHLTPLTSAERERRTQVFKLHSGSATVYTY